MPQLRGVQMLDKRLSRIFTNPRVGGSFGGLDTLWSPASEHTKSHTPQICH